MGGLATMFQGFARSSRVVEVVGAVVANSVAIFKDAAGRVISSLVTVDESGNVSTPGNLTAGAAKVTGESAGVAVFGFNGMAEVAGPNSNGFRQASDGSVGISVPQDKVIAGIGKGATDTGFYAGQTPGGALNGFVVFRGGQGATLDSSAILQVVWDDSGYVGGFLPPRMSTAQRDGIASPGDGLVIYNTQTHKLNVNENGTWRVVTTT